MIAKDRYLFPFDDLRHYVEVVCMHHDMQIRSITQLDKTLTLDFRPQQTIQLVEKAVHPQVLAALLWLADNLECISERMKDPKAKADDPRKSISSVIIAPEEGTVRLEFHLSQVKQQDKTKCKRFLKSSLAGR